LPPAALVVAGALVLGPAWSALAWFARRQADLGEGAVAGDGALGLLGLLAGLVTAALLAARPGRLPAVRAAVVICAATLSCPLTWLVGRLTGAPTLLAVGMLLLWPLSASAITLLRVLVSLALRPTAGPAIRREP
jgi:hypothetical protein